MSFTSTGLWKFLLIRRETNPNHRDSDSWLRSVAVNTASSLARNNTGSAVVTKTSDSGGGGVRPGGNNNSGGGNNRKNRETKESDTLEQVVTEVLVSVVASALIGVIGLGIWHVSAVIARAITGEEGVNDVDKHNSGAAARLHALLKKRGRQPKRPLRLSSHESHLAEDIVDPDDIDDGFADIGGLDNLKQEIWELVSISVSLPTYVAAAAAQLIAICVSLFVLSVQRPFCPF